MRRKLRLLSGGRDRATRRRRPRLSDEEIAYLRMLVDVGSKHLAPFVALKMATQALRTCAVQIRLNPQMAAPLRRKMANETRDMADAIDHLIGDLAK